MSELIDAPFLSNYQGGDLLLFGRMQDMGDDGQAGVADGTAVFLAPTRGRVIDFMGVCETGIDTATLFRIQNITGSGTSLNAPAVAVAGEGIGWIVALQDSDNVNLEKGDLFTVESDGAGAATGFGYIYVLFRPDHEGASLLPTNAFVISGRALSGVGALIEDWPSIGDVEVLEFQIGQRSAATGDFTAFLEKNANGANQIATLTIDNTPGSAGAGAGAATSRIVDADRLLAKEDWLRVESVPDAGATGQFAYNVICRRR